MSDEHNRHLKEPKPFTELILDSLKLYRTGLLPVTVAALIGGLASFCLALLVDPASRSYPLVWAIITDAIPVGMAEIAILVLAIRLQQGAEPGILSSYFVGIPIAPYYLFGKLVFALFVFSILLVALSVLGPWSLFNIPIFIGALFFFARFCLWGPIIVSERLGFYSALRLSWFLVKGKTRRTMAIWGGVYLSLFIFFFLVPLQLIVVFPEGSTFVLLLTQALTLPPLTIFTLLLYQDYRNLRAGESNPDQSLEPGT